MLSKIFLKRSLFESLVGAELFISSLPGTSAILEDSSSKLVLFNEETGKFINLDATEDLPIVIKYSYIKQFFNNYIGANTILKLKRRENSKYVEYLVNPIGIEGDTDHEDSVGLWVRGNYLRLDDNNKHDDKWFWGFTPDRTREKVVFSFTLFPRIWYLDLPTESELEIYTNRINK